MPRPDRSDGPSQASLLVENTERVRARIRAAALAAGRPDADVRLIAVTKSVAPRVALALARAMTAQGAGASDLGESRLPSLEAKVAAFRSAGVVARWHFIGHLQRNKARRVARLADEIHAVDTDALLATLARIADEDGGARPGLYLQVKLTAEAAKHGLAPADVPDVVSRARARGQHLRGLMTMAPLAGGPDAARPVFERLAALAADLVAAGLGAAFDGGRPRLSMGMSGDLEAAIAAGADDVRVGPALFEGLADAEDAA
jgi:pyridoxal phosphate enzyme (YggS family)